MCACVLYDQIEALQEQLACYDTATERALMMRLVLLLSFPSVNLLLLNVLMLDINSPTRSTCSTWEFNINMGAAPQQPH